MAEISRDIHKLVSSSERDFLICNNREQVIICWKQCLKEGFCFLSPGRPLILHEDKQFIAGYGFASKRKPKQNY
ncbi:unnamed protein product [Eruca vesicaria subsp. sativa]|uniref:Uncharacterized protein n=1 Tax=Eruca vesicaria subsp. sativa TaxID=29727 RepID=A0ABC8LT79_ERUVS|nr:unnamed protein product [Eruca vesicaria subsp. sativa]